MNLDRASGDSGAASSRAARSTLVALGARRASHDLLPLLSSPRSRATSTLASGLDAGRRPGRRDEGARSRRRSPTSSTTAAPRSHVRSARRSQARVALAEKGLLERRPRRLRDLRQDEPRRDRLPAEGRLPARARGRDRRRRSSRSTASRSADVQLVLPDDTLFADQSSKATRGRAPQRRLAARRRRPSPASRTSSPRASRASTPQNVTITDETGTLLWPTASAGGGTTAQHEARRPSSSTPRQLGAQINALLTSTLGAGKAHRPRPRRPERRPDDDRQGHVREEGHAAHAADRRRDARRARAAARSRCRPARREHDADLRGRRGRRRPDASSNYTNKTGTTTFGVDKTVERTRRRARARCSSSTSRSLVDKSVPAAQVASLQKSVASLAGIDPKRGDTLAVSRDRRSRSRSRADGREAEPARRPAGEPARARASTSRSASARSSSCSSCAAASSAARARHSAPEPTWLREIESAPSGRRARGRAGAPRADRRARRRQREHVARAGRGDRHAPARARRAARSRQWMKE